MSVLLNKPWQEAIRGWVVQDASCQSSQCLALLWAEAALKSCTVLCPEPPQSLICCTEAIGGDRLWGGLDLGFFFHFRVSEAIWAALQPTILMVLQHETEGVVTCYGVESETFPSTKPARIMSENCASWRETNLGQPCPYCPLGTIYGVKYFQKCTQSFSWRRLLGSLQQRDH